MNAILYVHQLAHCPAASSRISLYSPFPTFQNGYLLKEKPIYTPKRRPCCYRCRNHPVVYVQVHIHPCPYCIYTMKIIEIPSFHIIGIRRTSNESNHRHNLLPTLPSLFLFADPNAYGLVSSILGGATLSTLALLDSSNDACRTGWLRNGDEPKILSSSDSTLSSKGWPSPRWGFGIGAGAVAAFWLWCGIVDDAESGGKEEVMTTRSKKSVVAEKVIESCAGSSSLFCSSSSGSSSFES